MQRKVSGLSYVVDSSLLGFQNCIIRLSLFALLVFCFLSASVSQGTSMESLERSPWELLISLLKLARLERRRPKAAEPTDTGRSSGR